jgi:K+-sensing histidine kinase KdpD
VVDSGTGLSPEHHAKIWEPFESMDGSTGLGLYVVQKQCEANYNYCAGWSAGAHLGSRLGWAKQMKIPCVCPTIE